MFKTEPKDYQLEIYERSRDLKYCALFLEQGLGKSKLVIDTACYLYKRDRIDGLVVITKKSVAENWFFAELPMHMWDGIGHRSVLWGRTAKPERDLIQMIGQSGVMRILSINIEALRSERVQAIVSRLLGSGRFLLVVDESTIIKSISATQTRRAIALSKLAAGTRILSGEPAPNGPIDLYSQYKFLSPEALPGFTKAQYELAFCQMETRWFGGRAHMEPGKDFTRHGKQLFERMVGHCTFRLKKEDVNIKFPDIENRTVEVHLSQEQRMLYDLVASNVETELRGVLGTEGVVRADVIIARLTKLHQITSGFVVLDDGTVNKLTQNPKLDALTTLIRDLYKERGRRHPIIVWCHYRADVDAVTEALRAKYGEGSVVRVYGGIKDSERLDAIEAFMSGRAHILVANPQSLGWGLTLTVADTAIYYSNHYNYEYRVQSRDRIHRLGQKADKVHYIDLVASDTVDVDILDALSHKQNFCKGLFLSQWIQRLLKIKSAPVQGEVDAEVEEATVR